MEKRKERNQINHGPCKGDAIKTHDLKPSALVGRIGALPFAKLRGEDAAEGEPRT